MHKQLWRGLLSLCLLVNLSLAVASEQSDPYKMVHDVAIVTFDRMKNEKDLIAQDPERLRTIMEEELLPYIDYKFSAYKVLGKHFRSASDEEKREFVKVFRQYLITTYAVAMGYYEDQEVEFEPAADFEDKKSVTVRALVKESGRPDIKIAFKVRKNSQTNEWRAYDMVAEGISMLSSKQSEFESILRQQGIQSVIDRMKEVIEQPIALKSKETKES